MSLVPARFLLRLCYPCHFISGLPHEDRDELLDLPASCRIDNFAGLDQARTFADVRLAWNEFGVAFQAEVSGKHELSRGDVSRPRGSDGVSLWLDTRDARTSHRASHFCHQFHFLPAGAGPERDEPAVVQAPISRALGDAPIAPAGAIPYRCRRTRSGYIVEAFLPAAVLDGFDPEQSSRFGFFYSVRDAELGEQQLGIGPDFPYWEDPSLWSVLELVRPG